MSLYALKSSCKTWFTGSLFLFFSITCIAAEFDDETSTLVHPESLGPVIEKSQGEVEFFGEPIIYTAKPWQPALAPFLDEQLKYEALKNALPETQSTDEKSLVKKPLVERPQDSTPEPVVASETETEVEVEVDQENVFPPETEAADSYPEQAVIAILIDDLGYNRQGMEASLALPKEVALAILPETPYAQKTAVTSQEQQRITLLHAPMENQRELALGPGGLYAKMTKEELKATLKKDLDGLSGIQGVNNHMGSLLTTKADSMTWVMEVLQGRSLFFIDSLTSPKSVAEKIAKEHGLKTVTRDVFLDNIRTEKAIDKQFSRLIKLARRHGSALAIGHPYPETTSYLKKRLESLEQDGVVLVPLSKILLAPDLAKPLTK
ncbi:divergent polysaccharide deacetylase family protein [Marinomonas sp. 2405UD66-6]|uniref:divergent polysaccharide deacetylase family protein n=1 Tax=Marinomonas sp. 2405UD66-6 TaxID=3391834 RepID=UPI0039C8F7EA